MSRPVRTAETNWDDLRFVLALHRHGTVSVAALALGVSDVTVTRRVSAYEEALSTRLFERERGQFRITVEARVMIERLVAIGDEIIAVNDGLSGTTTAVAGRVRITGVSTLVNRILAPSLPVLFGLHPELEIELVVDTTMLGITYQRETDIAIRLLRPDSEPGAITRKIGDLPCGIYCHRDLAVSDASLPWVAYAQRSASLPHATWIEDQRQLDGADVRVRVDDAETLLQCVRSRLGKTLLPDALAERFSELVRLDGFEVQGREVWLVMHPSWREVRRIEVVATWLTDTLGRLLDPGGTRRFATARGRPGKQNGQPR